MPWTIKASGHSPDPTCEGWLLDRITDVLSGPEAGLRSLSIETDHFGEVNIEGDEQHHHSHGDDTLPDDRPEGHG